MPAIATRKATHKETANTGNSPITAMAMAKMPLFHASDSDEEAHAALVSTLLPLSDTPCSIFQGSMPAELLKDISARVRVSAQYPCGCIIATFFRGTSVPAGGKCPCYAMALDLAPKHMFWCRPQFYMPRHPDPSHGAPVCVDIRRVRLSTCNRVCCLCATPSV